MALFDILKLLLVDWPDRKHGREALAEMTEDRLRDIGVSRKAALAESSKPFWVSQRKRGAPAKPPNQSPAATAVSQNPAARR